MKAASCSTMQGSHKVVSWILRRVTGMRCCSKTTVQSDEFLISFLSHGRTIGQYSGIKVSYPLRSLSQRIAHHFRGSSRAMSSTKELDGDPRGFSRHRLPDRHPLNKSSI